MDRRRIGRAWLGPIGFILTACISIGPPSASPTLPASDPVPPTAGTEAVLLAAGDVAACDSDGDEATATLLGEREGTILTLGDHAYPDGAADDFATCYDPSWGRYRDRTYPSAGNHDYWTEDAAGYFGYFGARAGDPDEGWYSFDLGGWHLIALNSNCEQVGGCDEGSPQARWLSADLAANPEDCTLAYWHHPRWSSGADHGSDARTDALWRLLQDEGADLVLNSHDHMYERFGPMNADGAADANGMVEFIVGTGGNGLVDFAAILPTSAAHDNSSYGVLKLTLRPNAYDWEFVPVADSTFGDSGTAPCR